MYRLSVRHGIALPPSFYTQPMNAADVATFMAAADSLDQRGALGAQESYKLKRYRNRLQGSSAALKWTKPEQDIHAQVHAGAAVSFRPSFTKNNRALDFWGNLIPALSGNTGFLSYYSEANILFLAGTDTMFHAGDGAQPYDGLHVFTFDRADSGRVISTDVLRGGVRFHSPHLQLELAMDSWRQGPVLVNPLAFSGKAQPLLYGRLRIDMGKARYIQSAGKLQSQKWTDKFIYHHRIEVPLPKWRAMVSLNETVLNGTTTNEQDSLSENGLRRSFYGETRSWAPIYLIPFVPYVLAERYERDRDNTLMSIDATMVLGNHSRLYGEFFIDDMTITKWPPLFADDWGNKLAFSAGYEFFGLLRGRELSAGAEYTRLEPWVYTHFYGGSHRYTHFDQPLGSPLGPNADALTLMSHYGLTPSQTLALTLSNSRKNATARGGNERHVFQSDTTRFVRDGQEVVVLPDSWTKRFLGPGTVTTTTLGVRWLWEPLDWLNTEASMTLQLQPQSSLALSWYLNCMF
jgi:hypothetical protein